MKRRALISALILALVILLIAACGGCITFPVGDNYKIHGTRDNIVSIEIYEIGYEDEVRDTIGDEIEPKAILSSERYDEFLDELQSLKDFREYKIFFALGAVDPSFKLFGNVVKTSYTGGEIEYISAYDLQYYYDAEGNKSISRYFCDIDVWDAFIAKYTGD